MATAREIITSALQRIRVSRIGDDPSAEVMTYSLGVFNDLLSSYEADNLTTETVIITGNVSNGSRKISGLNATANLRNTDNLVVGMEVSGDGVDGVLHEILNQDEINLDVAATASGTGVTLTFNALPADDSLTKAFVAVLAGELADPFGRTISPKLAQDIAKGQSQIDGAFFKVPGTQFDTALRRTASQRRHYGVSDL